MATTINYVDRSILGVLGPTLRDHVFNWTNQQYAFISMSFKVAYALGMLAMGGVIDRIGNRLGYTLSIGIWSLFGMLHAAVTRSMGWIGFAAVRFGLGWGESGNFPACIKTVAEWFPKKERAFVTGLFNAGTNVGAVIAPLFVPLVVKPSGENWQFAFLATGAFSAFWIFLWLRTYAKPEVHPRLSAAELDYILSDSTPEVKTERLPWHKILLVKETWGFAATRLPDAVWYFYLFWGGFFLRDRFGLELRGLALPLIIIYVFADTGSIAGGWFSSHLIKKGWPVYKARKTAMLICALLILPVTMATQTRNQWISVSLIALAASAHQAWAANMFTLASDIFPKKATASVVGFGGMVGAAVGIIADFTLGTVLDKSGPSGYFWAFLIAGSVYLIVLGVIQILMPRMIPLDENLKRIR